MTIDDRVRIHLGGKRVEVLHFGRAHTDVTSWSISPITVRWLRATCSRSATPRRSCYPGGGSAREWTRTLDSAPQLDLDAVVPGHGSVTTKAAMRKFRDSTMALRTRVKDMLAQKRSRDDIATMLRSDFKWADLHLQVGLDGLLAEMAPGPSASLSSGVTRP